MTQQMGAGGPRPFLNFSVHESGDVGQEVLDQDANLCCHCGAASRGVRMPS
jgi:hypothetical protein